MLDGYDEYPRENKDVDRAILSTVGNCFTILTSRPAGYLKKEIRDKMDGEIVIEGFSEKNIEQCCLTYLGSREKRDEMLEQAKETGIIVLLHIPIILVMTIVVFLEKKSLPKTRTDLYKTIFRLVTDRTTLKTFGLKSKNREIKKLLNTLGELSWKALQTHQMLRKKVRVNFRKMILCVKQFSNFYR